MPKGFKWNEDLENKLLALRGCVFTVADAVKSLGIPISTIYEPRNALYLRKIKDTIGISEAYLLNDALNVCKTSLSSLDERTRIMGAKLVLDRADRKKDRKLSERMHDEDISCAKELHPTGKEGWRMAYVLLYPGFAFPTAPQFVIDRLTEIRKKYAIPNSEEFVLRDLREWETKDLEDYRNFSNPDKCPPSKRLTGYSDEVNEWLRSYEGAKKR